MLARTWWCAQSKPEYHGRLDLPAGDGVLLVVVGQAQTRRLGGNPLEDVVDKRVHDGHGLAGDARIRVDLLHHLVDVGLALLAELLLLALLSGNLGLGCLLSLLASDHSRHSVLFVSNKLMKEAIPLVLHAGS